MKKKLCMSAIILAGVLVLAGAALAAAPKAVEGQTKEPVTGASPAQEGKGAESQTTAPAAGCSGIPVTSIPRGNSPTEAASSGWAAILGTGSRPFLSTGLTF